MNVIYLILLLLATVCFLAAASNRVTSRVNLVALGLLCWVAVPLLQTIQSM